MQQLGIHQRRLYALIEAVFALIAMLLPWTKYSMNAFNMFGAAQSIPSDNGFRSWGWLVLIGVIAVVVCSFLTDKTKEYEGNIKYAVIGGFGLIALGAIIYLIRLNSIGQLQTQDGILVTVSAGMGLWMALTAGVVGLAWVSGILDKLGQKPAGGPPASTPPPPPPPPPPPTT